MSKTESKLTQFKPLSALFQWGGVLGACALVLLLSSCGQIKNTSSSLTTDCVLNTDQAGTLSGRWVQPAVPIAFHTGDWNSSEISAMIAAADKWNAFFATSMGYPAIDYGSAASPRMSSTALTTDQYNFCAQQTIVTDNGSFTGVVVIYKDGVWNYDPTFIAMTSVCNTGGSNKSLPRSHNAYMEINYANFFVNGNKVPDLQSIALHEMGHLMGINHSCETTSKTGVPNCNSGTLNASYRTASMYPNFSFYSSGAGEVRRTLNSNDQGRMNCVYKYL
jgi:hypothetical protein